MTSPPGFGRIESAAAVVVFAESFREEIEALDLAAAGGLERLLASPAVQELAGGRAGAFVIALSDTHPRLLLRRFAHGGMLRSLTGNRLRSLARPLAELEAAAALRRRGAPVPAPVLAIGTRRGLFWEAAVATVFEEHGLRGGEFLRIETEKRQRWAAARAAGHAVRAFHDAGGQHADLHVDNLLVCTNAALRVVVVDLDRARVVEEVAAGRRMRELMRLYRSLVKRGLARDGARMTAAFFQAYTQGDRKLRQELTKHLAREQRRVARHALAYRRTEDDPRSSIVVSRSETVESAEDSRPADRRRP